MRRGRGGGFGLNTSICRRFSFRLWRGGLLLFVYGLGMTAPFIVAALFARPFLAWVQRHRAAFAWVEKGMGAMLILFAVLIVTGGVNWIAQKLIDWVPAFQSIG